MSKNTTYYAAMLLVALCLGCKASKSNTEKTAALVAAWSGVFLDGSCQVVDLGISYDSYAVISDTTQKSVVYKPAGNKFLAVALILQGAVGSQYTINSTTATTFQVYRDAICPVDLGTANADLVPTTKISASANGLTTVYTVHEAGSYAIVFTALTQLETVGVTVQKTL